MMNIGLDQPVTHKYLTVAGAGENPVTLKVPIGITIGEVIEAAGGATVDDIGVLIGGVMMAKPAASLTVFQTIERISQYEKGMPLLSRFHSFRIHGESPRTKLEGMKWHVLLL